VAKDRSPRAEERGALSPERHARTWTGSAAAARNAPPNVLRLPARRRGKPIWRRPRRIGGTVAGPPTRSGKRNRLKLLSNQKDRGAAVACCVYYSYFGRAARSNP